MPPEPSAIFAWIAWKPAPRRVAGRVKEAGEALHPVGLDHDREQHDHPDRATRAASAGGSSRPRRPASRGRQADDDRRARGPARRPSAGTRARPRPGTAPGVRTLARPSTAGRRAGWRRRGPATAWRAPRAGPGTGRRRSSAGRRSPTTPTPGTRTASRPRNEQPGSSGVSGLQTRRPAHREQSHDAEADRAEDQGALQVVGAVAALPSSAVVELALNTITTPKASRQRVAVSSRVYSTGCAPARAPRPRAEPAEGERRHPLGIRAARRESSLLVTPRAPPRGRGSARRAARSPGRRRSWRRPARAGRRPPAARRPPPR